MRLSFQLGSWLLLAAVLIGPPATPARAQTPFALDAPAEQAEPADAPQAPVVPDINTIENPAVRAAYLLPRRTPSDHLRAVLSLLDLGQPELARVVFDELVALNLDPQQRATLVEQFGTAALVRLSREEALAPAGLEFSQATIQAAGKQAAAPDRVAQLVLELQEGGNTQRRAIAELARIGKDAVPPAIELLKSDNPEAVRGAKAALLRLAPFSEQVLLAALETKSDDLRQHVAHLLALLESPRAAPLLALPALSAPADSLVARAYVTLTGQVPTPESADGLLRRSLANLEGGVPAFHTGDSDQVAYWVWDQEAGLPREVQLSSRAATDAYAARIASDLAALHPTDSRLKVDAMGKQLEAAALLQTAGVSREVPQDELNALTDDQLRHLLRKSLERRHTAAAVAALRTIASRDDVRFLSTHDGRPSEVAEALRAPHPRVRYAALEAIARLNPTRPYPGASHVRPAIVRMLSSRGGRDVLVASPSLEAAATWAGGLASQGYSAQIAASGAEALEVAIAEADIEIVLIDMAITSPAVREVVFQLRRQPGTALVPIGLLAREEQLSTARQIANEHQGVIAYPRPHSDQALQSLATELTALLPPDWTTPDDRTRQSAQATEWMYQFLDQGRDFYRLRAAADDVSRAIRRAAPNATSWATMATLGTPDSQRTLVDSASTGPLPIETRQAAAEAFATSVERFGLLLTADQILRQYDLYNASEREPRETQEVLGKLLDTIESQRDSQRPAIAQ